MITIELPFPPSANRLTSRGKNGVFKTKAARDYTLLVQAACSMAGVNPVLGFVKIEVEAWLPATNRDLGNTGKLLEDVLQGFLYDNDKLIVESRYIRHEAEKPKKKRARVIVTVESTEYKEK